ncbi:hypothetical protein [Desulfolithobacter sp.]
MPDMVSLHWFNVNWNFHPSFTHVRELVKLGTNLRQAISIGLSRKGPWRLARTLATHSGITNKWLKDQGLLSVKDLWVHIHYPATAR